jgi:uncharacterized protein DUF1214
MSDSQEAEALQRVRDGRSWSTFCRALEQAGQSILQAGTPPDAFDRAEGFRYLTRLLRAGLESQLEYSDPRQPGFYQLSNETIKIGNDNPDNVYWNARISGRHEYRITGTRGAARLLCFATKGGGYERDGTLTPTGELHERQLVVAPDGRFEVHVSSAQQPGNWLPMRPDTTSLVVRQTFDDRRSEEPARLSIECLDPGPTPGLDPAELEANLLRAAAFVRGTADLFVGWMANFAAHENALPPDDQLRCQRAGGDSNIFYCNSRWRLAPDEALVVVPRRVPRCDAWNFQLSNFWMESLDYRVHRIHLNQHSAVAEPDGRVRIVVAHRDPGPRFPNWLTTAGHTHGGMLFRWIGADEHPEIDTRVVKLEDLPALP